MKFRWTSKKRF